METSTCAPADTSSRPWARSGPPHNVSPVLAAKPRQLAAFSLRHVPSGYAPPLRPCEPCVSLAKTSLTSWGSPLRLSNSLTNTKQDFTVDGKVGLYVCGVTPYDTTHLGHARTYIVFDVLLRHLLSAGHRVHYVQNVTDVDESIIKRAAQLGESYDSLGDRYTAIFMEDLANLGILPAAAYPKATGAIEEMQEMIRRLLATDHAYRVGSDVFFRVSASQGWGRLSRLDRNAMLRLEAAQDDSTSGDPRKEDPLDFPLWRAADHGPAWDSPWGPGRPGWHLECSTLAIRHVGKQLDIHGGGEDLVFPHHECEIAQSEAVTGVRPFARFWVHVAMVRLDGRKMSKSDGNMVFARDLLGRYSPDAIRLYLLQVHYRSPVDFDEADLRSAASLAAELAGAAGARVLVQDDSELVASLRKRFVEALDDDLDTPAAIEVLRQVVEVIGDGPTTYGTRRALRDLAAHLGLNLEG